MIQEDPLQRRKPGHLETGEKERLLLTNPRTADFGDAEILRIKGVLILKRNATRDYLDFVALADPMGDEKVANALKSFDRIYRQDNGESPLQPLQIQLANPVPYDLEETKLSEYKNLDHRWHDWNAAKKTCSHIATMVFDRVCDMGPDRP